MWQTGPVRERSSRRAHCARRAAPQSSAFGLPYIETNPRDDGRQEDLPDDRFERRDALGEFVDRGDVAEAEGGEHDERVVDGQLLDRRVEDRSGTESREGEEHPGEHQTDQHVCADHPDDRRQADVLVREHASHHRSEHRPQQHGLHQRADAEPGRLRIERADQDDADHAENREDDDPTSVLPDAGRRESRSQHEQVRGGTGHGGPHIVGATRQEKGDEEEEQQRPEVVRSRNQPPVSVHGSSHYGPAVAPMRFHSESHPQRPVVAGG